MLDDVLHRIERRLKKVGISATKASKAAGLSEDAIRNLRRASRDQEPGRAGVSTRTIQQLAPVLETTAGWLMDGTGEEESARRTVPLVGYVGAGGEHFYASADEGLGEVDAPEGSTDLTRASLVRGESLGPLFDEWLVFYDDVRTPVTPDLIGKLCIVGLANDKVLVKRLRKATGTDLFHLESNTEGTLYDQQVLWAAKVKTMTPR